MPLQQFTVPQFIDVEDKIIGPITTRQFILMIAGAFFIFVSYRLFTFGYFLVAAIIIGGLTATLAFFKVNGMPFHFFLLNLIQTSRRPTLRVWSKQLTWAELKVLAIKKPEAKPPSAVLRKRPVPVSGLAELALVVDTGGVYRGEEGYAPE